MKRYIFFVLILCFTCESHVFGQRNYLENLAQQILDRNKSGSMQKNKGFSMPSESGGKSGGNGSSYDGNQGRDFFLPGNGGTPSYPSNPIFQPGTNPQYRYTQPRNYPQYYQGQPIQSDLLYRENNFQQTYQMQQGQEYVQPQRSTLNGVSYSVGGMPGSPEMSNQFISIRCPASAVGSIYYTLASSQGSFGFSMSAGQEQRFRVGSGWTISYNNGSVKKHYKLEGGKRYLLKTNSANQWQILAAK